VKCVLVERSLTDSNRTQHFLRGWCDPKRGYFPIRLERALKPSGRERTPSHLTVVVEHFFQPIPLCFYPKSWTVSNLEDDRRPDGRDGYSETHPTGAAARLYVKDITNYVISSIEVQIPEPKTIASIGFPDGTYVYDEQSNAYHTAGEASSGIDKAIVELNPLPEGIEANPTPATTDGRTTIRNTARAPINRQPRSFMLWIVIVNSCVLFVIVSLAFVYRRR